MRVLSVVGARPQFIKAALLSREFQSGGIEELLVHTGQHYDASMSDVFFRDLKLPQPHTFLNVGSASHGAQTGRMMIGLEPIVMESDPDCVLVYGDTNSTLAGALVAAKLHKPLVHVEAGVRSFDRRMPEEVNRVVVDQLADLLLAPSESAVDQLLREGVPGSAHVVGDLMVDLARMAEKTLAPHPEVLDRFRLRPQEYAVVTIHRASNTDDAATLARLIAAVRALGMRALLPVHPRMRGQAQAFALGTGDNVTLCDPLPYLDMLGLVRDARVVLTDSGGLQKEAVALGTPCVTLRDTTEWNETLDYGWNVLAGSDPAAILAAAKRPRPAQPAELFEKGDAASRIVDVLRTWAQEDRAVSCVS